MRNIVSIGGAHWEAPSAVLAGRIIDLLGECQALDSRYIYPGPAGEPNTALYPTPAGSYAHQGHIAPLSRYLMLQNEAEASALDAARKAECEAIAAKEGGAS